MINCLSCRAELAIAFTAFQRNYMVITAMLTLQATFQVFCAKNDVLKHVLPIALTKEDSSEKSSVYALWVGQALGRIQIRCPQTRDVLGSK